MSRISNNGLISDELADHRKKHGASMLTLENLIETKVGQNRMAPSPWYKHGDHIDISTEEPIMLNLGHSEDGDGFAMYGKGKRADGVLIGIGLGEAGSTPMQHQDRVGGTLFIEEHGNSYRLITNKFGKPISLGPGAWRALNGHEQAFMHTMRDNHEPNKTAGKGSATK